jgi:hypothetical protein
MAAMGVVKTAIDQIIDVIAMGYGFMAAARSMAMGVLVNLLGAAHRVFVIHLDDVLLGLSAARVHEMAIFQIIDVIPVPDSHMTAIGAVLMGARANHCLSPLRPDDCVLPWTRRRVIRL